MSPKTRDVPLNIPKACEALGDISRSTLYREVAARRLTLTKIRGGSFVMESEIARYLRTAPKTGRAA